MGGIGKPLVFQARVIHNRPNPGNARRPVVMSRNASSKAQISRHKSTSSWHFRECVPRRGGALAASAFWVAHSGCVPRPGQGEGSASIVVAELELRQGTQQALSGCTASTIMRRRPPGLPARTLRPTVPTSRRQAVCAPVGYRDAHAGNSPPKTASEAPPFDDRVDCVIGRHALTESPRRRVAGLTRGTSARGSWPS